jgi:hypothetical protein
VSGAFSLAAAQSILDDTSITAMSAAKDSAILLCWASACFILALVFIIATQLLYTDPTIRKSLQNRESLDVHQRISRNIIVVCASGTPSCCGVSPGSVFGTDIWWLDDDG